MKLRDAIHLVDRSDTGGWTEADSSVFDNVLDVSYRGYLDGFGKRVKKYYLIKWYCTDSKVGLAVYYFDDEPIAVSFQRGRKSSEDVEFVSREAAKKLRDFILSLGVDENEDNLPLADLDEEIGDKYNVSYSSQLLVKEGVYNDEKVKVTKEYSGYTSEDIAMWGFVDVLLPSGETKTIPMNEFHIPLHVKSDN